MTQLVLVLGESLKLLGFETNCSLVDLCLNEAVVQPGLDLNCVEFSLTIV